MSGFGTTSLRRSDHHCCCRSAASVSIASNDPIQVVNGCVLLPAYSAPPDRNYGSAPHVAFPAAELGLQVQYGLVGLHARCGEHRRGQMFGVAANALDFDEIARPEMF